MSGDISESDLFDKYGSEAVLAARAEVSYARQQKKLRKIEKLAAVYQRHLETSKQLERVAGVRLSPEEEAKTQTMRGEWLMNDNRRSFFFA